MKLRTVGEEHLPGRTELHCAAVPPAAGEPCASDFERPSGAGPAASLGTGDQLTGTIVAALGRGAKFNAVKSNLLMWDVFAGTSAAGPECTVSTNN